MILKQGLAGRRGELLPQNSLNTQKGDADWEPTSHPTFAGPVDWKRIPGRCKACRGTETEKVTRRELHGKHFPGEQFPVRSISSFIHLSVRCEHTSQASLERRAWGALWIFSTPRPLDTVDGKKEPITTTRMGFQLCNWWLPAFPSLPCLGWWIEWKLGASITLRPESSAGVVWWTLPMTFTRTLCGWSWYLVIYQYYSDSWRFVFQEVDSKKGRNEKKMNKVITIS